MATATSDVTSAVKAEDVLGQKFDKCLVDTSIKVSFMATGLKGLGLQHSGRSLHEYVSLYF